MAPHTLCTAALASFGTQLYLLSFSVISIDVGALVSGSMSVYPMLTLLLVRTGGCHADNCDDSAHAQHATMLSMRAGSVGQIEAALTHFQCHVPPTPPPSFQTLPPKPAPCCIRSVQAPDEVVFLPYIVRAGPSIQQSAGCSAPQLQGDHVAAAAQTVWHNGRGVGGHAAGELKSLGGVNGVLGGGLCSLNLGP